MHLGPTRIVSYLRVFSLTISAKALLPNKVTFTLFLQPPIPGKDMELAQTTPSMGEASQRAWGLVCSDQRAPKRDSSMGKGWRHEHAPCAQEITQDSATWSPQGPQGIAKGHRHLSLFSEPTIKSKPELHFPNENVFYLCRSPCKRKALL